MVLDGLQQLFIRKIGGISIRINGLKTHIHKLYEQRLPHGLPHQHRLVLRGVQEQEEVPQMFVGQQGLESVGLGQELELVQGHGVGGGEEEGLLRLRVPRTGVRLHAHPVTKISLFVLRGVGQ